ncbi:hypothetical protein HDF16_006363 [Granulicella aggregans]|uniref:Uncharacterized protein n=2 Tax=Granulicella aggregans TaxID=474949 RepID=A0A7W7ZKN0_9BACT|nr:hypothetical protein [Granulicella aggregans]
MFFASLRLSSLRVLTITVAAAAAAHSVPAFAAPNSRAMYQALVADYPLTQVGQVMFDTDYTRITKPGAILAVRLPGIYADVANTKNAIVNTNYVNGQIAQATGFAAAFGGTTAHSRTLNANEKVYITQIFVKKNAVQLELLTVDVATLGDGMSTRYRAELNVKLPGLDTMTPEDVKKTIDTVIADPAVASAVESKTVKLGMTPDEVKHSLGIPDKIVDLGTKQVFIYKDMKVILIDGKVSDVQ